MNSHREVVEVEKTEFFMPYAPVVRVLPGLPLGRREANAEARFKPVDATRERWRMACFGTWTGRAQDSAAPSRLAVDRGSCSHAGAVVLPLASRPTPLPQGVCQ